MHNGDYVWYENTVCLLAESEQGFGVLMGAEYLPVPDLATCEGLDTRLSRQAQWIFDNLGETDREGVRRYEDDHIRLELDPLDHTLYVHTSKGREVMLCRAEGGIFRKVRLALYEPNGGFVHLHYINDLYGRYAPQN